MTDGSSQAETQSAAGGESEVAPVAESADEGDQTPVEVSQEVQAILIDLATEAVPTLTIKELPARLRTLAGFRNKSIRKSRARRDVWLVLVDDADFRHRCAARLEDEIRRMAEDLSLAEQATNAEANSVAAGLWLLRPEGWQATFASLTTRAQPAQPSPDPLLARELEQAKAAATKLRKKLDDERKKARVEREKADRACAKQISRGQTLADAAQREATALRHQVEGLQQEVAQLQAQGAATQRQLDKTTRELQQAHKDAQQAKRSGRQAQLATNARTAVLMEALHGAVRGLSDELGLPSGLPQPADTMDRSNPDLAQSVMSLHDAKTFRQFLTAPRAHLIVDGYNVTKTLLGDQGALADQRERLVKAMGALAAQTGVEATAVFDGRSLGSVPPLSTNNVRVRFSPKDVTADDEIIEMLGVEPVGRVLLVVSDDQDVQHRATKRGARAVPVAVFASVSKV